MDLEHDERLLERRGLLSPALLGALAVLVATVIAVVAHGVTPLTLLVASIPVLAALAAAVTSARHVVITDRRIVVYRVLLARLARRFPRLAPFEAQRRVVIPFPSLIGARRSGELSIVLSLRDGAQRTLDCHDTAEATHLFNAIQDHLRRAPWLRPPVRQPIPDAPPRVSVKSSSSGIGARCPYCHDDVPEDEAVPCGRCGALQHEECMEVHGGCAAFGCTEPRRARLRE